MRVSRPLVAVDPRAQIRVPRDAELAGRETDVHIVGIPERHVEMAVRVLVGHPPLLPARAECFDTTAIGKSTSANLLHSFGINSSSPIVHFWHLS